MIHITEEEDVTCVKLDIIMEGKKINRVYVFLTDGMLVDTGPKRLVEELIPFYDKHAFDLVTLTHSHEDHTGTAPWIQENRDVPIYLHPKGIDICAKSYPYPEYRQFIWGKREKFHAIPMGDTVRSRSKEWQVIYTPGHASDHNALYNQEAGIMFAGDLYVNPKTKVIMGSESIPTTMDSIKKLLTYDFGAMFCCHAGYVPEGRKMIKQKLEYLENLSGEVKHLHQHGLSVEEIREKLFPEKYKIIAISGGEWDSLHVITSILSEEI
ncbi:MBL fold metallo-hydrolase [Lentibacillus sp. N15]|uniref:MBL fold metallo-hydrolase n=1 Tax=Lentibacillus songyuanensis TaxID=3136161 RepID=UPI0031BB45C2